MELLTSSEVATLLGISDMTVRRMAEAGTIPHVRLSEASWWRFERQALEKWAQERNVTLDWSLIDKQ